MTCPLLVPPSNGDIVYTNGLVFGSMALYRCDPGFMIGSGDSVRNCTADGTWSGFEATCVGEDIICTLTEDIVSEVPFNSHSLTHTHTQILMNALKGLMAVIKYATTHLVHLCAAVRMVLFLITMAELAMVYITL